MLKQSKMPQCWGVLSYFHSFYPKHLKKACDTKSHPPVPIASSKGKLGQVPTFQALCLWTLNDVILLHLSTRLQLLAIPKTANMVRLANRRVPFLLTDVESWTCDHGPMNPCVCFGNVARSVLTCSILLHPKNWRWPLIDSDHFHIHGSFASDLIIRAQL